MAGHKGNKNALGNNGGRPLEYGKEMCEKAKKYIEECKDSFNGGKIDVKFPNKGGLALYLGVSRETLYDWAEKYPEFSDIMRELMAKQEERLLNGGLSGNYNSTIAKLILSKHGYRDVADVNNNVVIDTNKKPESNDVLKKFLGK